MSDQAQGIRSILATDCGSTTTKAILIEKRGDEYHLVVRGEAPTTVEAPVEDVTAGVTQRGNGGRGARWTQAIEGRADHQATAGR